MSRTGAEAAWQAVWLRRGWPARLLYPLSRIYGALVRQRRLRYLGGELPVHRMPVPVIVVGNVVVGGAGKTPTVLALLAHLKASGWHPGVVSRGHGRRYDGILALRPDTLASDGGDEPVLIRRKADVPVYVGRARAEAARALLSAHPEVDVLVCDDGLQHLSLGRDIAIAVFDDRGLGNGWLLPAGLLREHWPPTTGDPFAPQLVLRPGGPAGKSGAASGPAMAPEMRDFGVMRRLADHAVGMDGDRTPLDNLKDMTVTAVAGVARPERFFNMLRERGLRLGQTIALPDHAAATAYDVLPQTPAATVLCTEKDAVKAMPQMARRPPERRPAILAVPLELKLEPAFLAEVDRRLAQLAQGPRLSSADGHQTA